MVIERFIPFAALLPHIDVMVTNGGFGGVQFALTHGVPLVVSGTTEEKPEIAARIAWSGVGINLGKRSPEPQHVRTAVRRVLSDQSYRENAKRIAAETPADPAALAADLVIELGRTVGSTATAVRPSR
ncbi:MAG: nucleotide disphospho-sugar-binding domain-containing protein [Nakamurella sp.]